MFSSVLVSYVAKVEDGLYTITSLYKPENNAAFILTFDFGVEVYEQFLAELTTDLREPVRAALSRQPYQCIFPEGQEPKMLITGEIGDKTYTNENESYRPFIAEAFTREPD